MRLIVIGNTRQRRGLREQLEASVPDVVGEFSSLAEARGSDIDADAFVVAAPAALPDFDDAPVVDALTPREIEVLELVAEGLSNKAIAVRLGISDQTVNPRVLRRIGARFMSRTLSAIVDDWRVSRGQSTAMSPMDEEDIG